MAVKDRGALPDLPRVLHDDDLHREVLAPSCRLVLRVRRDVATPDVLDRDVPDVEPNVVARLHVREHLVAHLNRLQLRLDATRRKSGHHPGLQDTRLNTANGVSPNARDLVDVLQRKTQRLLNRAVRLMDVVKPSRSVGPLYHGMLFERSIVLSRWNPEMETNEILSGLSQCASGSC